MSSNGLRELGVPRYVLGRRNATDFRLQVFVKCRMDSGFWGGALGAAQLSLHPSPLNVFAIIAALAVSGGSHEMFVSPRHGTRCDRHAPNLA